MYSFKKIMLELARIIKNSTNIFLIKYLIVFIYITKEKIKKYNR